MDKEKIKETLAKQLELLSEISSNYETNPDIKVVEASYAMCEIANLLSNL